MDEFGKQLILELPNLAALVWIVYWQGKRLDKMLDQNQQLIDRLLDKQNDPAKPQNSP